MHTFDESVDTVDWHPDGRRLAAGDLAGTVAVLDLQASDDPPPPQVPHQPGGVTRLAWSPNGDELAAGGANGSMSLLSPDGCDTRFLDGPVAALAWSPGGDLLAVAAGWSVTIFDHRGQLLHEIGPLFGAVHDLAWAHGPGTIAAATRDAIAWLTPGLTSEPVEVWDATGAARSLATDTPRTRLASGDLGGVLRVADLAARQELAVSGFDQRIERLAWSPCSTRLAVPDGDDITLWTLDGITAAPDDPVRLDAHHGRVTDLAFDPGGTGTLASTGDDGRLIRWPLDHPNAPSIAELGAPARCARWRPGHPSIAVGCADGSVHLR